MAALVAMECLILSYFDLFTPNELQFDFDWSERILAMNLAAPLFRPADIRRPLFSGGFWILRAILAVGGSAIFFCKLC